MNHVHRIELSNGQVLQINEHDDRLCISTTSVLLVDIRTGGLFVYPISISVTQNLLAKIPTLEQFRASGRHCADLRQEVAEMDVDYTAVGRVYMRGYYLESTETWGLLRGNVGDWSFCAGSQQLTGTLAEMEEKLYEYAKHDLI